MFARYLKQAHKLALAQPKPRYISFLKKFTNKKEAAPEQQPPETDFNQQDNQSSPFSDKFQQNYAAYDPTEHLEQETENNPLDFQSGYELSPTVIKSNELQEAINFELDLPYKLYGSHLEVAERVTTF